MDDLPPSYEEAVGIPLDELSVRELFRIPDVSRVQPQNQCNESAKTFLVIYQFSSACGGQSFLKIDDWVHPLISGETVFSLDWTGLLGLATPLDSAGVFISLWIDGISPQYAYPLARLLLDIGLHVWNKNEANSRSCQPTVPREELKKRPWETFGFRAGFDALARFVVWSAFVARTYVALRVGLAGAVQPSPASCPGAVTAVNSNLVKGLGVVRVAGDAAASFTSSVVAAVGEASRCVTQAVAPHVEKGGIKLIQFTTGKRAQDAEVVLDSVKGTASMALEGFEKVYVSVSDAMKWLGQNAKNSSASFLARRFGNEAGAAASEAIGVLGSAAVMSYNVGFLTTRGLTHVAAVNSAKAWAQSGSHRMLAVSSVADDDLTPSAPPVEDDDDDDYEDFELLDLDEKPRMQVVGKV